MDAKLRLTKHCLTELNLPTDDASITKHLQIWWRNPRLLGERSFALTPEGFEVLSNQINLKFYELELPDDIVFTNQLVIWLDRYIDCPFFLTKKTIFVSREKVAVQLILFNGDLAKFGKAKSLPKNP